MITDTFYIVGIIFSSIPSLVSGALLLYKYRAVQSRNLLVLSIVWFCLGFNNLFVSLAIFINSPELFKARTVFLVIMAVSLQVGYDLITNDKINNLRFVILLFITSGLYVVVLNTSLVEYNSGVLVFFGISRLFLVLIGFYLSLLILLLSFHFIRKSKKNNRFPTIIFFIGALFLGPITILSYWMDLHLLYFREELFASIGIILITTAIYYFPVLMFMLPYELRKLYVIDQVSSKVIYSFSWEDSVNIKQHEKFVVDVLSATSEMYNNLFHTGLFSEIKFENGSVMFNTKHSETLAFVLLVNRYSKYISNELDKFAKDFIDTFHGFENIPEVTYVDKLVDKYFNLINDRAEGGTFKH